MLLLADGSGVWRIDHNQEHRGIRSTHLQRVDNPNVFEVLDAGHLGSPPFGPAVAGGDLWRAFAGSARFLNIDTRSVEWIDPPEEVSR